MSKPSDTEKNVISQPTGSFEASGQYLHFGYYETQGNFRPTQEDALVRHVYAVEDLAPKGESKALSPEELAQRLWTCYRQLDENILSAHPPIYAGSTAISILYDGQGTLITALLGDAAAFAVVYDNNEQVLGVERLNRVTHKPTDQSEQLRIETAGGFVSHARVDGNLAISRSIGDKNLKKSGVCSEAHVSIQSIAGLITLFQHANASIGKIQILASCDGFTDAAGSDQSKAAHESYLMQVLRRGSYLENISESDLAAYLVKAAIHDGSTDNISIAIQTLTEDSPPCLLGVYDGHGGSLTSTYIAGHIGSLFRELCAISKEEYEKHPLGVSNHRTEYQRDNKRDPG